MSKQNTCPSCENELGDPYFQPNIGGGIIICHTCYLNAWKEERKGKSSDEVWNDLKYKCLQNIEKYGTPKPIQTRKINPESDFMYEETLSVIFG